MVVVVAPIAIKVLSMVFMPLVFSATSAANFSMETYLGFPSGCAWPIVMTKSPNAAKGSSAPSAAASVLASSDVSAAAAVVVDSGAGVSAGLLPPPQAVSDAAMARLRSIAIDFFIKPFLLAGLN